MHQCVGYRRREEWFNLEAVAYKYLRAAERLGDRPQMLSARRWLAQSQINQQRVFTALEHLGQLVLLGREISDPKASSDEKTLRDLIQMVRPRLISSNKAEVLQMLVSAETIAGFPSLDSDKALLAELTHNQPIPPQAGAEPEGPLTSLDEAGYLLHRFALRHCGPPQRTAKGLAAVFAGKTHAPERHDWDVSKQEMNLYNKDASGQLTHKSAPCMSLHFAGKPEVVVNVFLNEPACDVVLMQEMELKGTRETAFLARFQRTVDARQELVNDCLNELILEGIFVKTSAGMRYRALTDTA